MYNFNTFKSEKNLKFTKKGCCKVIFWNLSL